jgi:hypothetical protein
MCWDVWASTAEMTSSRTRILAREYTARARETRAFWPPDRILPLGMLVGFLKVDHLNALTARQSESGLHLQVLQDLAEALQPMISHQSHACS